MNRIRKGLKKYLIFSLLVLFIILNFSLSIAYYNFKKVYVGGGELPILNINYNFTLGDESSIKNITYNGQSSEEVAVSVNTFGNNLSGYVKVYIFPSWQDTLSNSVYNNNNEVVYACFVNYNQSNWTEKNGWLYLNNALDKDQEIELFNGIVFNNLPDNYRGKKIDITIICQIYQINNLPENWGN